LSCNLDRFQDRVVGGFCKKRVVSRTLSCPPRRIRPVAN
jgi:hypothetical protein